MLCGGIIAWDGSRGGAVTALLGTARATATAALLLGGVRGLRVLGRLGAWCAAPVSGTTATDLHISLRDLIGN